MRKYISKFIYRNLSKDLALLQNLLKNFTYHNIFRNISKYISKYFSFRNISKIVSKYFENGFEIFFEIFCNRNNSKYFRTGWISWIRICNLGHAKNALDYIFEIVQNFVLCIEINLQILYYKIRSDLCL